MTGLELGYFFVIASTLGVTLMCIFLDRADRDELTGAFVLLTLCFFWGLLLVWQNH